MAAGADRHLRGAVRESNRIATGRAIGGQEGDAVSSDVSSPAGSDKEGPTQAPNPPPQLQLEIEGMKSKDDTPMRSAR